MILVVHMSRVVSLIFEPSLQSYWQMSSSFFNALIEQVRCSRTRLVLDLPRTGQAVYADMSPD